uniref:Uncharacterized protein n=1 Tax=Oryza rufipogon TaxID=4529 RepID=A0A0E0P383_ORYRU
MAAAALGLPACGGAAPRRIEPAAVAPSGGGSGVGAAPPRIEVAAAAASASRCAPPRVEAAAAGRAPSVLLPSPTPPKTEPGPGGFHGWTGWWKLVNAQTKDLDIDESGPG